MTYYSSTFFFTLFAVIILAILALVIIISQIIKGRNKNNSKNTHSILKFIVSAAIILAIIFGVSIFIDRQTQNHGDTPTNTDGQQTLTSRSARASDIEIMQNEDIFSLSAIYKVTPNVDINDLQVTIYFLDSSNNTVTTKVKIIGNVSANVEYSFSFKLSDFSVTEIFKIEYWRYEVTGGTVSYFS